jgi:hypothetical protein
MRVGGSPMVKRMVAVAVLMSFAVSLAPGVAGAAVLDPDETSGPFDLRWLDAAPTHHDRIVLTVRFWPGFTGASLPQGHTYDLRRQVSIVVEGAPDGDFTRGAYHHEGYFFRHAGKLWLRNGEFGSSPCCWTTSSTRLDDSTLQVRFIPWWFCDVSRHRSNLSRDMLPRSARSGQALVVVARIEDEFPQQLAVLAHHANVQTRHQDQDPNADVLPADPDVMEPASGGEA